MRSWSHSITIPSTIYLTHVLDSPTQSLWIRSSDTSNPRLPMHGLENGKARSLVVSEAKGTSKSTIFLMNKSLDDHKALMIKDKETHLHNGDDPGVLSYTNVTGLSESPPPAAWHGVRKSVVTTLVWNDLEAQFPTQVLCRRRFRGTSILTDHGTWPPLVT